MTGRDWISEATDFYTSLFGRDQARWSAACWTVILCDYSDDQLLSRLSTDHELLPPIRLDELEERAYGESSGAVLDGRDAFGWLVRSGDTVGLLEVNGFAGSLTQTLAALTAGATARAVSIYWNEAIARANLSYAADGMVQVVDLVSGDRDSATVPEFVAALDELNGDAPFEVNGMAIVERLSGLRLDENLLGQQWPAIRFQMRQPPLPTVPDTAIGSRDPELVFALLEASPEARRRTLIELVKEVLDATDLAQEPAAAKCLAQFKAGQLPERSEGLFALNDELSKGYKVPSRGAINLTHPGWLRLQAGVVLFDLCDDREDQEGQRFRFQTWLNASYALGERWPARRAQYLIGLRHFDAT